MTTPPNAPDHGCSCGRPDCQYDKAWGNPLRETQPAPDAKPNATEVDVLAVIDQAARESQDIGMTHQLHDAFAAVAALLTREAALVARNAELEASLYNVATHRDAFRSQWNELIREAANAIGCEPKQQAVLGYIDAIAAENKSLREALIDVRDNVRDDSPEMWHRVDAAIALGESRSDG